MARAYPLICLLLISASCLMARADVESSDNRRDLLQVNRGGAAMARTQVAQQVAQKNIRQAVAQGARPQATQQAARNSQAAAKVIARPTGLPIQVAASATTPRPTGRHLLQVNRGGAAMARTQVAQQVAQNNIRQAAAQGARPQATQQAARNTQAAAKAIARPTGLPIQVAAAATRPTGRHLLQASRSGGTAARTQVAQQVAQNNIRQAAAQGARPQATQQAARNSQVAANVVGGRSGIPIQVGALATNPRPTVTPRPTGTPRPATSPRPTGRHLLQVNRGGAAMGRTQVAQQVAQKNIRQAAAQGARPQATQQAARNSQAAVKAIARPTGLPIQVAAAATAPRPTGK